MKCVACHALMVLCTNAFSSRALASTQVAEWHAKYLVALRQIFDASKARTLVVSGVRYMACVQTTHMTYTYRHTPVTRARPRRASPTPTSRSGEIGLGPGRATERPGRRSHAPSAEASSEMHPCLSLCVHARAHTHADRMVYGRANIPSENPRSSNCLLYTSPSPRD